VIAGRVELDDLRTNRLRSERRREGPESTSNQWEEQCDAGARTRTDDTAHAIDYLRQYSHFRRDGRTVRLSQAPQCTIRAHFYADSILEELWRDEGV
jgi:hypothetical protein